MKKLVVLFVGFSLVFAITPFISFAGSVELCTEAKTGMVTIEFSGKTLTLKAIQLVEEKLMFLPIPEGGMGGVIWIGTKYAGSFYLKDGNLVGHRGAIDYNYGDANTIYDTFEYRVVTFYAGEMGIAIKLYPK